MNYQKRIVLLLKDWIAYFTRVFSDGGLVKNQTVTQQFLLYLKQTGIPAPVFSWFGEAGYKQRTSGINTFATKLYSLFGLNDATQTTSTSQPYISGNIAPNEKLCLKNNNGDSRYMTHPTISFAANEAWSVTTVLNWNGSDNAEYFIGNTVSDNTFLGINILNSGKLRFKNSSLTSVYSNLSALKILGKTSVLNFTAIGDGILRIYINGASYDTIINPTNVSFASIMSGAIVVLGLKGNIYSYIIRSQALTPSQVAAEANFLHSLYPEIPSVAIGNQVWATSNCEMVATPQGNLIQNVTLNSNAEKITNGTFDANITGWTALGNHSMVWDSTDGGVNHIKSTGIGAVSTDIIRSAPMTFQVGYWYKVSFRVKSFSGNTSLRYQTDNISSSTKTINLTSSYQTYTEYAQCMSSNVASRFWLNGAGEFLLDNVSVQQVGWSDSTNLYDYVYANTSGTDEQKTYAAVKAAAFWCYYNNDPALGAIYNKLYNWYAVKLLQMGIDYYNAANPTTPWGWRVPTDTDFNTLATTLGGASVAGGKMKVAGTSYWSSPNTGADNSSGFSAIPGGARVADGSFTSILLELPYWTLTEYDGTKSIRAFLSYSTSAISLLTNREKIVGNSLRLIKN